jgi:hypothetical protein
MSQGTFFPAQDDRAELHLLVLHQAPISEDMITKPLFVKV